MASVAETETFQHQQLPDPSTYIRLLKLGSIDQTRHIPVHCKLTTWEKASAPTYTAISYTWGDPNPTATILVNGKKMVVRCNCEDVLKQPCLHKGYFWIDAICINQVDNDEKSFQVANMAKVFRNAYRTLACVGRHENDSVFLFDRLYKHRNQWKRMENTEGTWQSLHGYLWRMLKRKATLFRLYIALSMFLRRPYFQRVWIYQELFFGQHIQVCCEDSIAKLSLLRALYRTFWLWNAYFIPTGIFPRARKLPRAEYNLLQMDNARLFLDLGVTENRRLPLREVMYIVQKLQSGDCRDRVFGALATIDWQGRKPIQPDYSKDPFDLAVEVLQKLEGGKFSEFESIFGEAIGVAKYLELPDQPSSRLVDEIQKRRLKHFHAPHVNPARTAQELELMPPGFQAYGLRLSFHDARWQISSWVSKDAADQSALRPRSLLNSRPAPTINKWSKGSIRDVQNLDILLPEAIQPQDWILIPRWLWYSSREPIPSLIARDIGDGQLQLVDKALVTNHNGGSLSSWPVNRTEFRVNFDLEDAIILAYSCSWRELELRKEDESYNSQVDGYFEIGLCGDRSRSYARHV